MSTTDIHSQNGKYVFYTTNPDLPAWCASFLYS